MDRQPAPSARSETSEATFRKRRIRATGLLGAVLVGGILFATWVSRGDSGSDAENQDRTEYDSGTRVTEYDEGGVLVERCDDYDLVARLYDDSADPAKPVGLDIRPSHSDCMDGMLTKADDIIPAAQQEPPR